MRRNNEQERERRKAGTVDRAEEPVENYLINLSCQINDKFQLERDGDGCGCQSCKRQAVTDKNWVDRMNVVEGDPYVYKDGSILRASENKAARDKDPDRDDSGWE